MGKTKDGENSSEYAGLFISAEGLKGKQSVRATFRLPIHIIDLLGIVAAHLNLKQKSLFDQLVEDVSVLDKVAKKAHEYSPENGERRQKTFVLSRRSLEVLDLVARQRNIPRDVLVEVSIQRLLPVIDAEQQKQKNRALLHKDMESYLAQGENLLRKAQTLLGEDDQVSEMMADIVGICAKKVSELESIIARGQSMERFDAHGKSGREFF
ncbi:MAG: hypothetical protein BM485_04555 [Desulfobulbaceae bacterium DB1]|nr:MAG: hypothetical protein BM485_04555 [Desulfobulbaceae bacterium DB1]